jgi:hypothetical protein
MKIYLHAIVRLVIVANIIMAPFYSIGHLVTWLPSLCLEILMRALPTIEHAVRMMNINLAWARRRATGGKSIHQ